MNQESVALTLGREELALLLQIFHAPALPGLEENLLVGMSEEQSSAALLSAERSLRARGLIRVLEQEKRIEVDPVAMALVGSCLKPLFSLVISSQTADGNISTRYYHITPLLTVEHSSPEIGLHEFIGVSQPEEMIPRIIASLHLSDWAVLECPPSRITESILVQVRDRVRDGEIKVAQDLLREQGVADSAVIPLTATIAQPVLNASIVKVLYGRGSENQADGFAILAGNEALWILVPEEQEGGNLWVRIEPVSARSVEERLVRLLRD